MTAIAAPDVIERPKWRVSPLGEFLLAGGITPLLFPLAWLLRKSVGLDSATLAAGFTTFWAAHVINDPHFSVTYLLFYKGARERLRSPQRIRYALAGFVLPAAMAIWALSAIAMRSWFSLGLFIQLMFALVGWHYVKQGFGVMLVLCARRGVRFDARERLAILAHCLAGWAYAWASPFDPGRQIEEKGVVYMTIRHPPHLETITHVLFLATLLPLAWVLVRKRMRDGKLPIATPLVAMLASVWSWSIYSNIDPVVVFFVPALHSIQYLYFVWLMKGNEAREREGPPHFDISARTRVGILAVSAVALGWVLFHGLPTAMDDLFIKKKVFFWEPIGTTPYFAAIYAFVNIHHYLMDAVIWRRENPETRFLHA
jgi:hypothetical protein